MRCVRRLPVTGFQRYVNNPVERAFSGRVGIRNAMAGYYYTQTSMLQQLIHRFKYRRRKDIALYLGRRLGHMLLESGWLHEIEGIVPVPLNTVKEQHRGYNQAALLAAGIAAVVQKPVFDQVLHREHRAGSQTRRGRSSRWENVSDAFTVKDAATLYNRHLLLVDDVITTGATTEACSHALLAAGASVSICSLAFTSD
ncbi:ComF family protein [Chitinophaga agrisoli]|uniref:ComF family protein n=2 Tax=Chitinophaga agrisoli TaxID=2607653 RepID=A0A5B2W261_9BACT|nr:ComF family protein [Chitinophaga agrisoli]